ncbi:hypothetical protein E24_00510 [Faustovirus]|nr:hypothetical protein E24_00510 [Faustovirus]AMN84403.1 hypothetical protein D5a_00507 [Faustovirus]AMN85393.1 hypothetical protein E23_00510 [Faustovirus]
MNMQQIVSYIVDTLKSEITQNCIFDISGNDDEKWIKLHYDGWCGTIHAEEMWTEGGDNGGDCRIEIYFYDDSGNDTTGLNGYNNSNLEDGVKVWIKYIESMI